MDHLKSAKSQMKMFIQRSLIKHDLHTDDNKDELKRNKNEGGLLVGAKI